MLDQIQRSARMEFCRRTLSAAGYTGRKLDLSAVSRVDPRWMFVFPITAAFARVLGVVEDEEVAVDVDVSVVAAVEPCRP